VFFFLFFFFSFLSLVEPGATSLGHLQRAINDRLGARPGRRFFRIASPAEDMSTGRLPRGPLRQRWTGIVKRTARPRAVTDPSWDFRLEKPAAAAPRKGVVRGASSWGRRRFHISSNGGRGPALVCTGAHGRRTKARLRLLATDIAENTIHQAGAAGAGPLDRRRFRAAIDIVSWRRPRRAAVGDTTGAGGRRSTADPSSAGLQTGNSRPPARECLRLGQLRSGAKSTARRREAVDALPNRVALYEQTHRPTRSHPAPS